jgi:hypothetical protein
MQWDLSPFHPNNNVNGTGAIDWKKLHTVENGNILEHQERYVRKLVREANGFDNVFFEIQNEPWSDRTVLADTVNPYLSEKIRNVYPNSIDVADELSMAWQARVAGWITSEESALPKKHLIAQNYSNFRAPVRNLAPGVSIVNFHYAYPEVALLNRGLGKVIAYDETGFLGQNDEGYRRQAWNFMLSGGGMFDALDYSFSPGKEDGTDTAPNGPGGGSPAFRKQLRVLSEFLQKLPLEQMQPEFQAVKHSGGAYARALASSAGDYAIYFDGSAPLDVTLNLPSGNYAGEWVDPASGQPAKAEKFTHAGGDKALAAPAFQNGIALRLKRTPR